LYIRDLALAERIVERAINRRHGNTKAGSSIAVDDEGSLQPVDLLVSVEIQELGDFAQPGHQKRRPMV
jgi:hypothetical protein